MGLKELLETSKNCRQFRKIINNLYSKGFRNYDYAALQLSKAFNFFDKIRGKVSWKREAEMESSYFSLENQMETLWIEGYLT